ncbi:MAG TPA: hypothetical protein V6D50_27300 [Chroococcales cyanobacterium]|jgi:hypothetical protein
MAKVIDLKLQVIEEELDNYLEAHGDRVYRSISANPDLRQKLIDYVRSRVPGYCIVLEYSEKRAIKKDCFSYRSLLLRLRLETYIQQGIHEAIEQLNNF